MFGSKLKDDEKPKIKLKVTRPSSTYTEGETVEGKILITGIRRKINSLSIKALGTFAPSMTPKVTEVVPQLTKLHKMTLFEYENNLVNDYVVSGSVKKSFKFKLESNHGKPMFETYYGYMFATKYVVYANCKVDDSQEGQAKVEIQLRSYVNWSNTGGSAFSEATYSSGVRKSCRFTWFQSSNKARLNEHQYRQRH
jgi:hypothetical protein